MDGGAGGGRTAADFARRSSADADEDEDGGVDSSRTSPIPWSWREKRSRRSFLRSPICPGRLQATAVCCGERRQWWSSGGELGLAAIRKSGRNGEVRERGAGGVGGGLLILQGATAACGMGSGMAPVRERHCGDRRKKRKIEKIPLSLFFQFPNFKTIRVLAI